MSKGLESLDKILEVLKVIDNDTNYYEDYIDRAVANSYIVKKELKALEIINTHDIRVDKLRYYFNCLTLEQLLELNQIQYEYVYDGELTQQEFELLKEVFGND